MRLFLALVPLSLAACSVDSDGANEQVTIQYDKQQIRNTAAKAGQAAKDVTRGLGNVAVATGRAIRNEVGTIEVDVRRTRPEPAQ